MKQKKQFRILTKLISVILCLCLMFTGCITGAAFFARPSTSVLEKRKLTEFPKFTMTTFLNGQYFSEISTWPDGTTKALIITAKPDLTSARLFTKDKVSFKYGKLETRIMIPKTANGLWPAFWLLGNTGTWPSCGEIDVLEMGHADGIKNGTQEKYYSGACHWGVYQNGGYPNYGKFTTSPTSLQDGKFHKFVLEWTPDVINMYLDDATKPYYSMDISDRSLNTSPGNYFNKQFYMLVNLAIGGNFTGVHDRAAVTALNSGEKKM